MCFVHAYWGAARRLRGWRRQMGWRWRKLAGTSSPPPPETIVVGCVAENDPRFLAQARRLTLSLRWFGGSLAGARMLVCVVEGISAQDRRALEEAGAEVRIVGRFDARNGSANKLQFFPEALAAGARGLLLLDCDMVVVRDPLPLLEGGCLQARIADVPSVTHDAFRRLFRHYGLPLPRRRYRTTLSPERTIRYCNSAMVFLPRQLAGEFVPVWREWNARILDALELLGPCAHHCHQASLTLAMAAHPIPFAAAPVALHFPMHMGHLPPVHALFAADPVILHYHQEIDGRGRLLPSRYPLAQARIDAFNRRLGAAASRELAAGEISPPASPARA
ncbi:MAG TPA: hypothetical protein VHR45_09065 [Thermoanaerobaculia bacterium]|nr:hypothetical protein [Thermoanaerobaculia bacterium]